MGSEDAHSNLRERGKGAGVVGGVAARVAAADGEETASQELVRAIARDATP